MNATTTDEPERISRIADDLRTGLRSLRPRSERELEEQARIHALRQFVERHPAADLYVFDPEGTHVALSAPGRSTSKDRGPLPFLPTAATAECLALLEGRSDVSAYLLAITVAMVAEERATAERLVRVGLVQHGDNGSAAQLRQWSALLLHLRGETSTPIFLELMRSPIATVRHAALASGSLIAVAEGAEPALDRILDAMGDEDPSRQFPALMRVVELQCRRRGAPVVLEWFQRLRRRAERLPYAPDWTWDTPAALTGPR